MLQWQVCFVKKQNSSEELLQNIAKKFVYSIICLLTNLCVVLLTGISPVTESHASLSTFNDQSVSFKVLKDGRYVINVEDSGKLQENGRQFKTISSCLYLVMMTGKVKKKSTEEYRCWETTIEKYGQRSHMCALMLSTHSIFPTVSVSHSISLLWKSISLP